MTQSENGEEQGGGGAVCSQCNNAAVSATYTGAALCVEHDYMFAMSGYVRQAMLTANLNDIRESISRSTGIPFRPVFLPPLPTLVQSSQSSSVNVAGDVGVVNTGQARVITAAVNKLAESGSQELADAIEGLTDSIDASNELSVELKASLFESLSFLAEQATTDKESRRPSFIKIALEQLSAVVGQAESIKAAAEPLISIIRAAFGA